MKNQNTMQRTLLEIESTKPANESDHDWIELKLRTGGKGDIVSRTYDLANMWMFD